MIGDVGKGCSAIIVKVFPMMFRAVLKSLQIC
jgi:hypothetical protein